MLRASCEILIKKLFEDGKIFEETKQHALKHIMSVETHIKIRNLIAMVILPLHTHEGFHTQDAFLRATVARVSYTNPSLSLYYC